MKDIEVHRRRGGGCEPGWHHAIDQLTACVAMSLYQYNISPGIRAEKLLDHFAGACAEPMELLRLVDSRHWATEMPAPTAKVFLLHALERYGKEARVRVLLHERYGEL